VQLTVLKFPPGKNRTPKYLINDHACYMVIGESCSLWPFYSFQKSLSNSFCMRKAEIRMPKTRETLGGKRSVFIIVGMVAIRFPGI
jgi:hypothetical protein